MKSQDQDHSAETPRRSSAEDEISQKIASGASTPSTPPASPLTPPAHTGVMIDDMETNDGEAPEKMMLMSLDEVDYAIELLRQGDKYGALKYMQDARDGAMNQAVEPQEYPKYVQKPGEPHVQAIAESHEHETEIHQNWDRYDPKSQDGPTAAEGHVAATRDQASDPHRGSRVSGPGIAEARAQSAPARDEAQPARDDAHHHVAPAKDEDKPAKK